MRCMKHFFITGNLIKRLHGHVTGVELIYNPVSAVFLTYGSWEEENSLRVWDKTSLECLTSYTMDRLVMYLELWVCIQSSTFHKPVGLASQMLPYFKNLLESLLD